MLGLPCFGQIVVRKCVPKAKALIHFDIFWYLVIIIAEISKSKRESYGVS